MADLPQGYAQVQFNSSATIAQANSFGRILRFLGIEKRPLAPSGQRRGGATQSLCPSTEENLVALIPSTNIGLTVAEHPQFWFYISSSSRRSFLAEFVLIDEHENDVYKTPENYRLPENTSGIISITLPQTSPPLQEGKYYRWVFSLICNPSDRSGDLTVNGWIERVPLESKLEQQLKTAANPIDRVFLYANAENGLWYEALTSLAQLRLSYPQDEQLAKDWISLLESVDLADIAQKPLTSCCQLENQSEHNER
jgi:hypothetical protein